MPNDEVAIKLRLRDAKKFQADAGRSEKALRGIGGAAKGAGRNLGGLGRVGAGAAALGLGAAAIEAKRAYDAYTETRKVAAQTGAVLKSTGRAANVSATQVGELATQLSRKSGIDDEAIQSSENMLLTFRGVRNEVGKGNDIFNQATKAGLDMSVAMGMDQSRAALQLGKALNDPTKGMTRLQRVGVTFTKQQQDQIKTLQKGGDTLGAQKVILGELTKEFGGSAAAQATPLDKLKVSVGNVEEAIGKGLTPIVDAGATALDGLAKHAEPSLLKLDKDLDKTWGKKGGSPGDKLKASLALGKKDLRPVTDELGKSMEDLVGTRRFGEAVGKGFETAAPYMADGLANAAPHMVSRMAGAIAHSSPGGILATALLVGFKAGGFGPAGALAGKGVMRGYRRFLATTSLVDEAGNVMAARTAQQTTSRLPASLDARKGKLRPGLKGFGGWMGHAAGAGMAIGIGLELEHWLNDQGYIDKAGQFLADEVTGVDGKKQAAQNRRSFASNARAGQRTIDQARHPGTAIVMGTTTQVPVDRHGNPRRRSRGGFVGGAGRGDVTPLMADPREFVLRPEATARFGSDALHALNSGRPTAQPSVANITIINQLPGGRVLSEDLHRVELRSEARR